MGIVSLVPLNEVMCQKIYRATGENVYVVEGRGEGQRDFEVMIARDRDITQRLLDYYSQIRFLFIVSDGVDKLPFKVLKDRKIIVANTTGISDDIMSNYVISAILLYSSRLRECIEAQRERYWIKYLCSRSLVGQKIVVFGAGRIGKAIAKKAVVFGLETVGIRNQNFESEYFSKIVTADVYEQEISDADYIVCCLPLTKKTKCFFSYDIFEKMKKTALFINISRGELVKEEDLILALDREVIGGAVLDVFEKEPLSQDSRLWQMGNVIISPHSSGRLDDFMERAIEKFISNYQKYREEGCVIDKIDLLKEY